MTIPDGTCIQRKRVSDQIEFTTAKEVDIFLTNTLIYWTVCLLT